MQIQLQLATGLSQMQALKPHWQALENNTGASVFIRFEWCWQQAQHQKPDNIFVLSAWHEGQCVAILPLTTTHLSHRVNTRVVTHLCQRFTDYQHLLGEDHPQAAEIFAHMVQYLATANSPVKRFSWYLPYPSPPLNSYFMKQARSPVRVGNRLFIASQARR
ncbi:hypothetical protein IT774_04120 [Salinimonas marina]|uniref:GNAT family N-acetyltransferase n=1 Tax=Salinimonas marina TaxID=2785918 RepID=A0A7S9DZR6_9ALTE|nr:hypothetical protein [Salinimonas marina]QPG06385.1 hypothetical protein IT774_04120 [Salinimonas marina]